MPTARLATAGQDGTICVWDAHALASCTPPNLRSMLRCTFAGTAAQSAGAAGRSAGAISQAAPWMAGPHPALPSAGACGHHS